MSKKILIIIFLIGLVLWGVGIWIYTNNVSKTETVNFVSTISQHYLVYTLENSQFNFELNKASNALVLRKSTQQLELPLSAVVGAKAIFEKWQVISSQGNLDTIYPTADCQYLELQFSYPYTDLRQDLVGIRCLAKLPDTDNLVEL